QSRAGPTAPTTGALGSGSGRATTTTGTPSLAAASILGQVYEPPESFVTSTSEPCPRITPRSPSSVYGPRLVRRRQPGGSSMPGASTTRASTAASRSDGTNRASSCRPTVRKGRSPSSAASSAASSWVAAYRQDGSGSQPGRSNRSSGTRSAAQASTALALMPRANGWVASTTRP